MSQDRGYGIGERNPETLPGRGYKCETEWENEKSTERWKKIRQWASKLGAKYTC